MKSGRCSPFPGERITKTLGLVRGNTIRARHIGRDIMAGLRTLVGGEIMEYTKLMAEAREQAVDRMVGEAGPGSFCIYATELQNQRA